MRCWANLDAADHAVTSSVDDTHGRSTVATDVDFATVWCHHQAVWARRHCNSVQHAISSGIEHGDGLVFEEPDVGLAYGWRRDFVWRAGRGWRRCQGLQHHQEEERENTPHEGKTPSASWRDAPILSDHCIDILVRCGVLY